MAAKIYTRTGDAGTTGLIGGSRVPKSHLRVSAYGEVDELNACLGAAAAALPGGASFAPLREGLLRIQAELFVVGAVLASPDRSKAVVPAAAARRLEAEIDRMDQALAPLAHFILPGGSPAAAWLHLGRAVCRRAERAACALAGKEPVPAEVLVYLNRLSDHLFAAARWANAKSKRRETPWLGLPAR